jgi:hypothetical protein
MIMPRPFLFHFLTSSSPARLPCLGGVFIVQAWSWMPCSWASAISKSDLSTISLFRGPGFFPGQNVKASIHRLSTHHKRIYRNSSRRPPLAPAPFTQPHYLRGFDNANVFVDSVTFRHIHL